jgi:uncharacterized membrane protein (DUF485 family)
MPDDTAERGGNQMSTTERSQSEELPPDDGKWAEVQQSADFIELRRRLRRFVFPMTGVFLVWYLAYVLLADYAHEFMSTRLFGNINVALVLGILQFVSTFVITTLYVRYANRRIDPQAQKVRDQIEGAGK